MGFQKMLVGSIATVLVYREFFPKGFFDGSSGRLSACSRSPQYTLRELAGMKF